MYALKQEQIKKWSSLILLICFVSWVFVIPLSLFFQLASESNIASSSIDLATDNPEFLELKVALALPYGSEWNAPQESEGLMEYNGEFYTLLSKDYKNDTLYFHYLKNNSAREIFGMLSDHVDANKDDSSKDAPSNQDFGKWFGLKYLKTTSPEVQVQEVHIKTTKPLYSYINHYSSEYNSTQGPPPRFV